MIVSMYFIIFAIIAHRKKDLIRVLIPLFLFSAILIYLKIDLDKSIKYVSFDHVILSIILLVYFLIMRYLNKSVRSVFLIYYIFELLMIVFFKFNIHAIWFIIFFGILAFEFNKIDAINNVAEMRDS